MKPARILLFGLLLASAPRLTRAQVLNDRDLRDVANNRPFSALNLNRANEANKAAVEAEEAHPIHYFTPDWRPGQVVGIDGRAQAVPGMRYNIVHRWLEVKDATVPGGLRVLPVGSIRDFVLADVPGQPAYTFGTYLSAGNDGRLFLQELTPAGPVHLLVRFDVEVIAPVRNVALAVDLQPGQERQYTRLYVAEPLRPEARELPLTQKAILRLFGSQAPQMAAYATQKQLRYADLADMARLVEHYNSTASPAPAGR